MKVSPFHYTIANIIQKKPVQSIIRYADKNPAIFQSGTVFAMSSILRPVTIMGTPASSENMKKDRLYSASKSIASGITDLLFSTLLFLPFNKVVDTFTRKLYENKQSILHNDKKACKMYKNLLNRSLKIGVVPVIAYLNFRYVKDIARIIMGKGGSNASR